MHSMSIITLLFPRNLDPLHLDLQSRLPLTVVHIAQLCFELTKTLVHLTFTKTAHTSITVMTLFLSFVTILLVTLVYSLPCCNKAVHLAVRL